MTAGIPVPVAQKPDSSSCQNTVCRKNRMDRTGRTNPMAPSQLLRPSRSLPLTAPFRTRLVPSTPISQDETRNPLIPTNLSILAPTILIPPRAILSSIRRTSPCFDYEQGSSLLACVQQEQ